MKVSEYQWLYNLLGVDTSDMPREAQSEIIWQNLPQSWQWFALIGILLVAAYIVFWLYRREMNSAPTWAKVIMATLRMGVLLALVVLAFSPALVYTKKDVDHPSVVVLRDDSQSMAHGDPYLDDEHAEKIAKVLGLSGASEVQSRKPTRVELLHKATEANDRNFIRELEYRGKLKLFDFSTDTHAVGASAPFARKK